MFDRALPQNAVSGLVSPVAYPLKLLVYSAPRVPVNPGS